MGEQKERRGLTLEIRRTDGSVMSTHQFPPAPDEPGELARRLASEVVKRCAVSREDPTPEIERRLAGVLRAERERVETAERLLAESEAWGNKQNLEALAQAQRADENERELSALRAAARAYRDRPGPWSAGEQFCPERKALDAELAKDGSDG